MAKPTLIREIVEVQKLHIARQLAVLRQVPTGKHYTTHDIAGSLTITTAAKFGRKLNQTVGLGLFGPVSGPDLAAIAQAYRITGLPPEIDMCAAVPAAVFALLSSSGYQQTGTIDTFELTLSNPGDVAAPPPLEGDPDLVSPPEINVTQTTDEDAFVRASVTGFRSGGRSDELLELLARIAARRADTTLFLAGRGEEVVGSGGMACFDVTGGGGGERETSMGLANFYIDSTIPKFRGMGVHAALLRARVRAARAMGLERAIASARNGSGSARNIERVGFAKVFETQTFTKTGEMVI